MLLTEEQKKERSNPWLWTEVEITSPKPRFWDNGFFVWLVFFFSSGRLEPRKHRTSCLLESKSVRWGSIHFQKVTSKKKSPFFSLVSPAAYTCALTLTPQTVLNPHTISQAACLLLLASPLLSWLRRSIHESAAHCVSMKLSERAASSPNFPWIRSWHSSERKDNVWTSASLGCRPSSCHRTSPSHT